MEGQGEFGSSSGDGGTREGGMTGRGMQGSRGRRRVSESWERSRKWRGKMALGSGGGSMAAAVAAAATTTAMLVSHDQGKGRRRRARRRQRRRR